MNNQIQSSKEKVDQLILELEKAIVGKRSTIQLMVVALLANGHVLFEDIPGVGKTLLVKALSKQSKVTLVASSLHRISFPVIFWDFQSIILKTIPLNFDRDQFLRQFS